MGERASASSLASEFWTDELDFLRDLINRTNPNGSFLEIGTAAGGTLCEMMKCFGPADRPRFVVVDPMTYFANQLEIVKRNLRQHGLDSSQVDIRVSRSLEAFQRARSEGEAYDFILIDASHKVRYVTQDLLWLGLLKAGGFVCFHDYNPRHKGVMWPVDRFLARHPNYTREGLVSNLLSLRKTATSTGPEIGPLDHLWAALLSPWLQFEISLRKRWRKIAR